MRGTWHCPGRERWLLAAARLALPRLSFIPTAVAAPEAAGGEGGRPQVVNRQRGQGLPPGPGRLGGRGRSGRRQAGCPGGLDPEPAGAGFPRALNLLGDSNECLPSSEPRFPAAERGGGDARQKSGPGGDRAAMLCTIDDLKKNPQKPEALRRL